MFTHYLPLNLETQLSIEFLSMKEGSNQKTKISRSVKSDYVDSESPTGFENGALLQELRPVKVDPFF